MSYPLQLTWTFEIKSDRETLYQGDAITEGVPSDTLAANVKAALTVCSILDIPCGELVLYKTTKARGRERDRSYFIFTNYRTGRIGAQPKGN